MLPEIVMRRRLHGANHSITHRSASTDYALALKASLDRRRAAVEGKAMPPRVPAHVMPGGPSGHAEAVGLPTNARPGEGP